MVRKLPDNSNYPNNDLKTEVHICRYNHSDIFETASKYLSTFISLFFLATHPSSVRYGKRDQVKSTERGVRGGRGDLFEGRRWLGRGGGVGHRGWGKGNGNKTENEVDISNPTGWYGKEKWLLIICDTQHRIMNDSDRSKAVNERRDKKMRTTNRTASVPTKEVKPEQNQLIAAIINGVQNIFQKEQLQ